MTKMREMPSMYKNSADWRPGRHEHLPSSSSASLTLLSSWKPELATLSLLLTLSSLGFWSCSRPGSRLSFLGSICKAASLEQTRNTGMRGGQHGLEVPQHRVEALGTEDFPGWRISGTLPWAPQEHLKLTESDS